MKLLPTGKLCIITLFLIYILLLILESKESFSLKSLSYKILQGQCDLEMEETVAESSPGSVDTFQFCW